MTIATPSKFQAPKKLYISPYLAKQKIHLYPDPSARPTASGANNVGCLAWSPLGNLIATGVGAQSSAALRIWNPEKSSIRYSTELRGHVGTIKRVGWNPSREAELATCGADGTVRLWDVRSKSLIGEVKVGGDCINMVWTPNGEEILVGRKVEGQDDVLVRIDRDTLSQISTHREDQETNQSTFSFSGQELFLTMGHGAVKVLDYPSMETLHTFTPHTTACYSIEVSPSASYVATGGSDALITLWDTTDWVCRRTFDRSQGTVRMVSFSCDGSYLVGGSDEGTGIEIGHVETGDYVHKIETTSTVPFVQWSPRDYSLAYAPGDSVGGLKVLGSFGLR